jgi:adenylyl cyclase-associated protein
MTDAAVSQLLARLEQVTARLESVEKQLASGAGASSGGAHAPASAASSAAGGDAVVPEFVTAWDDLVAAHIPKYVELSGKIGGKTAEQAALVQKAIDAERKILLCAAASAKPSDTVLQKLLEPCSTLMGEVGKIRETNRADKNFNNLSTISEGIGALGWVCVPKTPGPFVNEARASSEFYSNRILKDFKGKDETQTEWVSAWNTFLKDLFTYIKKYHTTELAWNPKGGDAASFSGSAAPAAATPKGPGGPPPPGPPKGFADAPAKSAAAPGKKADTAGLFAELNKGGAVTSGLKKVTNDMKTKNRPKGEGDGLVKEVKKNEKVVAPTKPPVLELDGAKWKVEYQVNNRDIVLAECEVKHAVYIYQCQNSVIQIKNKINSICLDSCTKVALVFTEAVAQVEIVNCRSVDVQCTGKVPTFAADKCSGVNIIVSAEGKSAEFVTSKCDAVNISFPVDGEEDPVEVPVAEQFKYKTASTSITKNCLCWAWSDRP